MKTKVICGAVIVAVLMAGCADKTVVIEENTKNVQIQDTYNINEKDIENLTGQYVLLKYNEDGIYAYDEVGNLKLIKEDGSKENLTEKEGLVDFNGYYALHGLKKNEITNTYNFVDVDKGIDEEIEEYSRVTVLYRASYLDYYQFDDYITGSDRYYMSMFYSTDVREDGWL